MFAAFALIFVGAAVASAQSAEFGRFLGGQVDVAFKAPRHAYGSLGLSSDRSALASFGGTLIEDRAWFFATAARTQTAPQFDSRLFGNLGDRNSIAATFRTEGNTRTFAAPSFLSLHYTGIVSSNAFFTASVSTSQTK